MTVFLLTSNIFKVCRVKADSQIWFPYAKSSLSAEECYQRASTESFTYCLSFSYRQYLAFAMAKNKLSRLGNLLVDLLVQNKFTY